MLAIFIADSTTSFDGEPPTGSSRRDSGKVLQGEVPAYSVVVPGSLPGKNGGPSLYCAVIVKRVDEQTRSKTSINELLRD